MDLQFNVHLEYTDGGKQSQIELPFYNSDKLQDVPDTMIPSIKEFREIVLFFKSENKNDLLFIDDLVDYEIEGNIGNNDEMVFIPSEYPINIFKFKIQPVSLVPGYYTLRVKHDNQFYYSYFKIIPKDLSIPEWKQIREDIESTVSGLANDYINRRQGSQGIDVPETKSNFSLIGKLEFVLNNFSKFQSALEALRKEEKYKILVKYRWNYTGKKNAVDMNSIRKMSERPEKKDYVYTPIHYLEYDVPENRWIKYIVHKVSDFCEEGEHYYHNILEQVESDYEKEKKFFYSRELTPGGQNSNVYTSNRFERRLEEIRNKKNQLKRISLYLIGLLQDDFMVGITESRSKFVPKALVLLPKYNLIYKYYVEINRDHNFTLSDDYHFYWKQTTLLYEIWVYIKTIKLLTERGFVPVSGWIYDSLDSSDQLPFLNEGTRVMMSSDDLKIRITYNESLLYFDKRNTFNNPAKTASKRNKPDIRIDIFTLDNIFLGNIIIDAKYQRLNRILKGEHSIKIKQQFREYRNSIESDFLPAEFRQTKCVQAVYGVYAGDEDGNIPFHFEENDIFCDRLKPGYGGSTFINDLLKQIEERKNRYHFYQKFHLISHEKF